ncbi:hypothetical protein E2C01_052516 [Portunus trituberculatus]|uniref:CCHC-type domain-containing protein n=1 Tax=Portunus trituberculatus TaxID=210409 RepID=A0A5B7GER8_PORTR|nr:hypothetical protein [Portunus trituberculatus]
MSAVVAAGHSRHTCGTHLHPKMTLSPHHNLRHYRLSLDPPGQGWGDQEKTLQLVASLRGPAMKILAHMTASQRSTYTTVAEVLRRRFGSVFQAEVYREQLKGRTRQQGESFPQLARRWSRCRHAYPVAPEEMVTVLSRDAFVDALEDQQVQIYVKQAHPADVQQALARTMEFGAFLYTTAAAVTSYHRFAAQKPPRSHLPARRTQVRQGRMRGTSSGEFSGFCWKCGKRGHRRSDCRSERRTRSLEDVRARSPTKACCENCGRLGHRRAACSQLKDVMMVGGNESRLGVRATVQPSCPRAPSV